MADRKEHNMNLVSELANDVKTMFHYRKESTAWQRKYNRQAPKAGDIAPDFTLLDSTGAESVTLSAFRGKKPVVLSFGSYT